jgi:hypothetical protein
MFPVPALPMLALPAAPPGIMAPPAAPIAPAPAPSEAPPAPPEAIGVGVTPCSEELPGALVSGPAFADEAGLGDDPVAGAGSEPALVAPGPL